MKRIKNIVLTLTTISAFATSCVEDVKVGDDFLEKAPGVDVNVDSVFSKAEYARDFLWNAYRDLYYGFPTSWGGCGGKMNMSVFEALSDCFNAVSGWSGVERYYYGGTYSAGETSDHVRWDFDGENVWTCVRKSWVFIENIHRATDMEESEKERLIAEAKILVASRYFDAFRHLGGLPIIDHAYTAAENTNVGRGTIEETVNFMIRLLDEAIATESLPWVIPADEIENWDGRMTKAVAYGLKCKIMCFAASPLFNDNEPYCTEDPQDAVTNHQVWWGGYKPELWTTTKQYCEDFFTQQKSKGNYALYESTGTTASAYRTAYRNAYKLRGAGQGNPEMLMQTRLNFKYASWESWLYYFPSAEEYGMFNPTLNFVDMFPMADGRNFSDVFDWSKDSVPSQNPLANRDPRLYENVLVNGDSYQGHQVELWVGGRERVNASDAERKSGFGLYKYLHDRSDMYSKAACWPYLRMSEIYLIYAEALAETGNLSGAVEQVDKVRGRVGLPGLAATGYDLSNKEIVISEIIRERVCELGFEDTRLFDMIRRKLAGDFTKPLYGLNIYRLDDSGEILQKPYTGTNGVGSAYPTKFKYVRFSLDQRYWQNNWSPKWYLEAFPADEINMDYGLTQNPGW